MLRANAFDSRAVGKAHRPHLCYAHTLTRWIDKTAVNFKAVGGAAARVAANGARGRAALQRLRYAIHAAAEAQRDDADEGDKDEHARM